MATWCSPTAAPRRARLQAPSLSPEAHPKTHLRVVRRLDAEAARCLQGFRGLLRKPHHGHGDSLGGRSLSPGLFQFGSET